MLCASIPESPVMKLSDHPLPVKKISSENVFYWWSHQVFRNQWNQKSDDRSKFSTPIQLRLYRGSNSPRECSPDVVAYSEKNHKSNNFFTPLATFPGSRSAIPCPILSDVSEWSAILTTTSIGFHKILHPTHTHEFIPKKRSIIQQSFVLRSNPSQHSLPFRIIIFLGNC